MYVRMYVCTYVCTYVCMYVCMHVYKYVCDATYACTYVCTQGCRKFIQIGLASFYSLPSIVVIANNLSTSLKLQGLENIRIQVHFLTSNTVNDAVFGDFR